MWLKVKFYKKIVLLQVWKISFLIKDEVQKYKSDQCYIEDICPAGGHAVEGEGGEDRGWNCDNGQHSDSTARQQKCGGGDDGHPDCQLYTFAHWNKHSIAILDAHHNAVEQNNGKQRTYCHGNQGHGLEVEL